MKNSMYLCWNKGTRNPLKLTYGSKKKFPREKPPEPRYKGAASNAAGEGASNTGTSGREGERKGKGRGEEVEGGNREEKGRVIGRWGRGGKGGREGKRGERAGGEEGRERESRGGRGKRGRGVAKFAPSTRNSWIRHCAMALKV